MNLIIHFPEWRQVYLARIGTIGYFLKYFFQKNILLFITCPDLKGGLFLQHAYATHINAEKIGKRCQIWQNVTIGVKHSGGPRPVIGDDVKICVGARVLGGIRIGNNVTIGANAVVISDIPDNSIAIGVPARIIHKNI